MSNNLNMSISYAMEDDNLSVVDKPIMSTQAIVFIALASASAAFTLGAGVWCLFYGAFGRGLRQRRAREGGRVCHFSPLFHRPNSKIPFIAISPPALSHSRQPPAQTNKQQSIASPVSAPEEAPTTPRRTSSFRLPWLPSEARSNTRRPPQTCLQPPLAPHQSVH